MSHSPTDRARQSSQCAQHGRLDLIETVLHPGALELRDFIGEDVKELVDQLTKQTERLFELREKKATDPGDESRHRHRLSALTFSCGPVPCV